VLGPTRFEIPQELLAQTLGSRRATVALSTETLQAAELIRYRRGRVTILDRIGLEELSCECYGVIRDLFERTMTAGPQK
jgi:hypothetical protein